MVKLPNSYNSHSRRYFSYPITKTANNTIVTIVSKKGEQMLAIFFILYYDITVTTNNCLSF